MEVPPKVKEVQAKTLLSPCGLPEFAYSMNPYTGCSHRCAYCYARFMAKYRKGEGWGSFVDVKVNAPEVARKDLAKSEPGRIFFSSVTDCYQPLEAKYMLAPKILQAIRDSGYPVSILTKSSLVQRDLKLISGIANADVGMTICFGDEQDRKAWEPGASSIQDRLDTLQAFTDAGVKTYAFFGPILPGISDQDMHGLFRRFAEAGIKEVIADRLNIKSGNLEPVMAAVRAYYPELVPLYQELFVQEKDQEYYQKLKNVVDRIAQENGLAVDWCY